MELQKTNNLELDKLLGGIFKEVNTQSAYFFSKQIKLLVSTTQTKQPTPSCSPEQSSSQEDVNIEVVKKIETQINPKESISNETTKVNWEAAEPSVSKDDSSDSIGSKTTKKNLQRFPSFIRKRTNSSSSLLNKKSRAETSCEFSEETRESIKDIANAVDNLSDFSSSVMEENDDICFDENPVDPRRPIIKYGTLPRIINCLIAENNQTFVPGNKFFVYKN